MSVHGPFSSNSLTNLRTLRMGSPSNAPIAQPSESRMRILICSRAFELSASKEARVANSAIRSTCVIRTSLHTFSFRRCSPARNEPTVPLQSMFVIRARNSLRGAAGNGSRATGVPPG